MPTYPEPRCPKVARYLLQFPRQDAVAYCHPHTKAAVRRATGQDQDLRTMLARTAWPCVRPFCCPESGGAAVDGSHRVHPADQQRRRSLDAR